MKTIVSALFLMCLIAVARSDSCSATMNKNDPYTITLSLKTGASGSVVTNYRPYNFDSSLVYNNYYENQFTLSPQGSDRAAVVDLGTQKDMELTFGATAMNGPSAYPTIHVDNSNTIVIGGTDIYNKDDRFAFHPLPEVVTQALQNLQSGVSFTPQIGHTYLINILASSGTGELYLTKMVVLDISNDNSSVAIRWDVIQTTGDKSKIKCFVSVNGSEGSQDPVGTPSKRAMGIAIAVLVMVCVLFLLVVAIIVVLGVLYKRMRQISGFSSSTPLDEKKPLMQK